MCSVKPVFMHDNQVLNDDGHLVLTQYVDFREPTCRDPITTLIKASEKHYAPEILGTIRVSKPECFRSTGESLITDSEEARVSRIMVQSESTDDPCDLEEALVRNDEGNRAAELAGASIRSTTKSIKRTRKKSETITYGKNWWIYCTAKEPISQTDRDGFTSAIEPDYDHVSYIYRPRAYALALGSMFAEQIGPRGRVQTLKSRIGELVYTAHHKSQIIVHGPVVYTEDPYKLITSSLTEIEAAFLPMFVKRMEYQSQYEYRFLICSEDKLNEKYFDLEVSLAMLGSMKSAPEVAHRRSTQNPESLVRSAKVQEVHTGEKRANLNDTNETDSPDTLPDILNLISDPATPVAPSLPADSDSPTNKCEVSERVIRALRHAVARIPDAHLVAASSSAFHAEPLLRWLCEEFEDPVRTVAISDDGFVVITINAPDDQGSKACIAIGSHGEGAQYMQKEGSRTSGFLNSLNKNFEFPLGSGWIKSLTQLGVRVRQPGADSVGEKHKSQ